VVAHDLGQLNQEDRLLINIPKQFREVPWIVVEQFNMQCVTSTGGGFRLTSARDDGNPWPWPAGQKA
jgi:hypothetical protein